MSKVRRVAQAASIMGSRGFTRMVKDRVTAAPLHFADDIDAALNGAKVLELGGPSSVFQQGGLAPAYPHVAQLDNVNYAGATLWEADLVNGGPYAPATGALGTQFLLEATDLSELTAGYDAVISSHTIEHTANPLRALREWRRLCRPGGTLVLVLPHRDGTFDHDRPLTTLQHLRDDESADMGEDDRTHVEEILHLHDVARDPGLSSRAELSDRVDNNLVTRSMHQHVFSTCSALDMVDEAGWTPVAAEARWPHDIVILARNGCVEAQEVPVRSVFRSDRCGRSDAGSSAR